ncbi:hypothetical protein GTW37_30115 [Streptomyces sp. SID4931]|nr:hypothetical protein [Streptomyces sp. SID4931]
MAAVRLGEPLQMGAGAAALVEARRDHRGQCGDPAEPAVSQAEFVAFGVRRPGRRPP